jgi:hypothetical protein
LNQLIRSNKIAFQALKKEVRAEALPTVSPNTIVELMDSSRLPVGTYKALRSVTKLVEVLPSYYSVLKTKVQLTDEALKLVPLSILDNGACVAADFAKHVELRIRSTGKRTFSNMQ